MTQKQQTNQPKISTVFVFHFLLFIYPLLTLLWRRSYPVFSLEVGVLFLLAIAIALLVTAILSNARPVIANALTLLLVALIFLVQFNLLLEGLSIFVVGSLFVAWKFKTDLYLYSLPILAALIVGAWFDSADGDISVQSSNVGTSANQELPPVVHILLDGFIGLDGLPDYTNSEIIRNEIHRFFNDYKFQVFPRAYSRYSTTVDSLYSAFNFENGAQSRFSWEVLSRREHVMQDNAQFEQLESIGYRLNIYQSEHLDFCQSNLSSVDKCLEYAQPNVASIRQAKDIHIRSKMLVSILLRQSALLEKLLSSQGWLPDQGVAIHDPRVLTNLKQDLLHESNGQFFFAHILLPHAPFTYLHDCSINYQVDYLLRYPSFKNESGLDESVYEERNNMYFEQMDCALLSLRRVFDELEKAGIFERSIIVVHGDHGSMIAKYLPRPWNIDHLTNGQYRAHYSTLFAVKFPHSEYQIDDRVLPLGALIEGFSKTLKGYIAGDRSESAFSKSIPDDPVKVDPYIYLLEPAHLRRVDIDIFKD